MTTVNMRRNLERNRSDDRQFGKISGVYVIWGYRDQLLQEPEHEQEPQDLSELRTCAARDDLSSAMLR